MTERAERNGVLRWLSPLSTSCDHGSANKERMGTGSCFQTVEAVNLAQTPFSIWSRNTLQLPPPLAGKRVSPHVLRHYLPFRTMSCGGMPT
jgi:hypothetical protein